MPFGWFSKKKEEDAFEPRYEKPKPSLGEKISALNATGRVNVSRHSKKAAENALYKEATHVQIVRYVDGVMRGEAAEVMANRSSLGGETAKKIDKLIEQQIDLEMY